MTCLLILAAPAAASAGFVQRSGTNLSLDGSAFRFVGHNNYQLTSVAGQFSCGRALDGAMVDRVLQDAKDAGATVIRTWFFQSFYRGAGNSYAPFDRVLDKAAAKGLKVIPVLVNHYPDCEPSGAKRKDEGFYDYGYKTAGWGYPQPFKDYAYNLASRYRNNATIAFWQIVNEAETSWSGGCNTTIEANGHQRAANVLRRFVDDMGSAIHAAAPNHRVSLGTIGTGQCGAAGSEYRYVHESAGSDICEDHDYDRATQPMPGDPYNGLAVRVSQCNAIGKPMLIGESGIVADVDSGGGSSGSITATTLKRRADFFAAKLNAAFDSGIDGYLLWEKSADASGSVYNLDHGRYGIGPSDPLNSVTLAKARQLTAGGAGGGGTVGGGSTVRADFEDGTPQSWEPAWGSLALANSTDQHVGGTRSLKLSFSNGWPAARMRTTTGATAGTTITFRVYRPASAPANLGVLPFVSDSGWANSYGPETSLAAGWNTVTYTVPTGVRAPLQAIGLQVADHGWAGSLYVDNVVW
ncbi:MAG: mannan endo,4-beta-mannosidase [Solirubrobacteraceae bacterium]|nr:mannan endo,4-beta-mannosidase [Solirubrobacteraceae bacterium]